MRLPNILSPVFMFAFIFHCRSFSPYWPLAFLIRAVYTRDNKPRLSLAAACIRREHPV